MSLSLVYIPVFPESRWRGHIILLSFRVLCFFAYPASFLPFVPFFLFSGSGSCPYLSCLCLPFRTSFLRCTSSYRRKRDTAPGTPFSTMSGKKAPYRSALLNVTKVTCHSIFYAFFRSHTGRVHCAQLSFRLSWFLVYLIIFPNR